MDATAALPDDVLLEILARVTDVAALFRCATTCNRWRRLVADPSFLRRRWPDNASSLVGFFAQRRHHKDIMGRGLVPPAAAPTFVPVPRSASLCSLVPDAAGLLDRSTVLTSRRGLLLLRFYPHRARVDRDLTDDVHLAVCNLLAGTCDVLPPLKFKSSGSIDLNGYAILSGADFCSNGQRRPPFPAYFKVLIIASSLWCLRYNLHTFSSDQPNKWSAPSTCHGLTKPNVWLLQRIAVVQRGTAHWLFWDSSRSLKMLDVDTTTGRISLEKIKIPLNNFTIPRLSVNAQGMLMLFCLRTKGLSLKISTRQEKQCGDGTTDWLHIQTMDLKRGKQQQNNKAHWMCLGEKSGMLLVVNTDRRAYISDLRTGAMEVVSDWFSGLNYETAVPVEIDWPELFMSSLQPRSKMPCDAERRPVPSASRQLYIRSIGSFLLFLFFLACIFSYLKG